MSILNRSTIDVIKIFLYEYLADKTPNSFVITIRRTLQCKEFGQYRVE